MSNQVVLVLDNGAIYQPTPDRGQGHQSKESITEWIWYFSKVVNVKGWRSVSKNIISSGNIFTRERIWHIVGVLIWILAWSCISKKTLVDQKSKLDIDFTMKTHQQGHVACQSLFLLWRLRWWLLPHLLGDVRSESSPGISKISQTTRRELSGDLVISRESGMFSEKADERLVSSLRDSVFFVCWYAL